MKHLLRHKKEQIDKSITWHIVYYLIFYLKYLLYNVWSIGLKSDQWIKCIVKGDRVKR